MPDSILRQMLRPPAQPPEADPAVDGLAGVLGKAASVAGLSALEVQLETQSRAAKQCEVVDFIAALPENGLYFRLECHTEGQFGLLALDVELVENIVNISTGTLESTLPPPRPPTDIDAALTRPFLDEMFKAFASILRELRSGKTTHTYHTAQVETEPSPHLFPEIPYLQIGIDFEFLNGKAKGHVALMLPAANTSFSAALPRPGESRAEWRAAFNKAVEAAPACFDVVLYRKKMPIGQILKLKTGDMLEIPARALENLSLESRKGVANRSLMQARLGEFQDMRAAKITQIGEDTPPDDTPPLLEVKP